MAAPCSGTPISKASIQDMLGHGPFDTDSIHDWNGHKIQILEDGSGVHASCLGAEIAAAVAHTNSPDLPLQPPKGIGTSPLWIGVALLAAGTVVGVFAILGFIPLGPIGAPVFTAAFGATFLASLVYMARQHGMLQCAGS